MSQATITVREILPKFNKPAAGFKLSQEDGFDKMIRYMLGTAHAMLEFDRELDKLDTDTADRAIAASWSLISTAPRFEPTLDLPAHGYNLAAASYAAQRLRVEMDRATIRKTAKQIADAALEADIPF